MTFTDFLEISLPILLYLVSIVAVTILTLLLIKTIHIMNKVNLIVDDVDKKVKSLDGAFKIIDSTADRISFIIDKVTEGITSFILGLFKKNKKGENENEEGN